MEHETVRFIDMHPTEPHPSIFKAPEPLTSIEGERDEAIGGRHDHDPTRSACPPHLRPLARSNTTRSWGAWRPLCRRDEAKTSE